jgi:hypothetical protein
MHLICESFHNVAGCNDMDLGPSPAPVKARYYSDITDQILLNGYPMNVKKIQKPVGFEIPPARKKVVRLEPRA